MLSEAHNPMRKVSYFLISVSTRENLDLCIRYGLAGFPGGENGAWTFCEVEVGDLVSFLYGARAHNLYRVTKKEALSESHTLGPWKPLSFRGTGKTYSFPFRLQLQPIRIFDEALVRAEFSYVAENLLLRGGYSKSHFQADQTTLQSVSQMGAINGELREILEIGKHASFTPRFTRNKQRLNSPEVTRFKESILQCAIRNHLTSDSNLQGLLNQLRFDGRAATDLEILGEKALPEGHIDLLLKDRVPLGSGPKIPIEVKTKIAQPKDLNQLHRYLDALRGECPFGILIAADFNKKVVTAANDERVKLVHYELSCDLAGTPSFEEICQSLVLRVLRE